MYNDRRYSFTRFSVNRENRAVEVRESFSEVINAVAGAAYGGKNAPAVRAEKNTPAVLAGVDVLTARVSGSKNTPAVLGVSEILTSMTEATSQTTKRTTVQLTIPSGAELRINSELFLVPLNGRNVLNTQSGDWINISRNLLRIIVESASGGNLRGQLIYTVLLRPSQRRRAIPHHARHAGNRRGGKCAPSM